MHEHRVRAVLPVYLPLEPDLWAEAQRLVHEITTFEGLLIPGIDQWGDHTLAITAVDVDPSDKESFGPLDLPEETVEQYLLSPRIQWVLDCAVTAKFEVSEPFTLKRSDGGDEILPPDQAADLVAQIITDGVTHFLPQLAVVSNLAGPGALDLGAGHVSDGRFQRTAEEAIPSFSSCRRLMAEKGWPMIRELPFSTAWCWTCDGDYLNGLGETPVGRAFNAFTRLFESVAGESSESLFWALLGLEAVYSDGSSGVTHQVTSRIQLLLGEHAGLKKAFSHVYKVRSAFIHGGMSFPGKYFYYDGLPEYERYSEKVNDATELAGAMLVATLQELIARGWHSVSFPISLSGDQKPPSRA